MLPDLASPRRRLRREGRRVLGRLEAVQAPRLLFPQVAVVAQAPAGPAGWGEKMDRFNDKYFNDIKTG